MPPIRIRASEVPSTVAWITDLPVEQIMSRSRRPELVRARDMVIDAYRRLGGLGWSEIGRLMRRHHTTVMAAEARILARREIDRAWSGEVELLEALLRTSSAERVAQTLH